MRPRPCTVAKHGREVRVDSLVVPGIDPTGSIFVYGTLLDETLAGNILERAVRAEPARLLDFELLRLEGFPYPIAFYALGEVIEGRLYRGLTNADYERLDAYEGVGEGLYQRVEARIVADGAPEPAWVYVVTEKMLARYGAL